MNQKKAKAIKKYLAPAKTVLEPKLYRKLLKMTKRISEGVPLKEYEINERTENQN